MSQEIVRTYDAAIACLNSRRALRKPMLDDMRGSDGMSRWWTLIGHSIQETDKLNLVHVAGTNGKGSTSTFAASFLLNHGRVAGYPRKIGLYTSPHLENVRERIKINGQAVSEEVFSTGFFEVWESLPLHPTPQLDIPRYLQLIALTAYHIFLVQCVDVVVCEAHLGGQYDATNFVPCPIVTAITSIGRDHVDLLGEIESIAWHKAGIFKHRASALSVTQEPIVERVLRDRADQVGVPLSFVGYDSHIPTKSMLVSARIQRLNCSLALAIVHSWLQRKAPGASDVSLQTISDGIAGFSLPGRFHRISEGSTQWYLDGAHNEPSMEHAVEWFVGGGMGEVEPTTKVLIFGHFSNRDGSALLNCIARFVHSKGIIFHEVIITSYDERRNGGARKDRNLRFRFQPTTQILYGEAWKRYSPETTYVHLDRTIEEALERARGYGTSKQRRDVLVTGSLHLVSGALWLLGAW